MPAASEPRGLDRGTAEVYGPTAASCQPPHPVPNTHTVSAAVPPRLDPRDNVDPAVASFLDALREAGWSGDIRSDYSTRLTAATDNSIYQLLPAAVIFPRAARDVTSAMRLIDEPRFHAVALTARGGGTGTNGQALTSGVVMDLSRHMRAILELDLNAGFVRVQPGVVLDDLNAYLKPHGVFFAPNLSPSNRATLGGMISTDASGEGSRLHGKTSQHVLELEAAAARRRHASHAPRLWQRARRRCVSTATSSAARTRSRARSRCNNATRSRRRSRSCCAS